MKSDWSKNVNRWRITDTYLRIIAFFGQEGYQTSPKGNQPWVFIERADAEAEAPILWSPGTKSQLIGKDPDAEKDWGQEEKQVTEDEMVGWHHRVSGHEFEPAPGDGEGLRSLACRSSSGHRVGHDLATEEQQQTANGGFLSHIF